MKTTKKITAIVLALMMLLGTLAAGTVTASAAPVTSGSCGKDGADNVRWSLNTETGVFTVSGKGPMNDYVYYYQTAWSSLRDEITSVVIEDGVTTVGSQTFRYSSTLRSVTLPETITKIGYSTFAGCSSLVSINIPESVISIGGGSLLECSPDMVIRCRKNSLADGVARWFELSVEYYGEPIKEISGTCGKNGGDNLRWVMNAETGALVISGTGEMADFSGIDEPGWFHCGFDMPTSAVIEEGVTSIGRYAFFDCYGLESVTLPSTLTSIGEISFTQCHALPSITIPSSVTSIGEDAFWNCSSLKTINCMPDSYAEEYFKGIDKEVTYACDVMPDIIGTESSAYKVDVTVSVPVKAPKGTEVYINGGKAEGSNGRYSMHIGQLDSDKSITVQIKYGTTVLETSSVKVTVDGGFFAKIASFFSNFLFNGFKWKTGTISF